MPLVLLLNRSGQSAWKSGTSAVLTSSECIAATPLTEWVPTIARLAMRTWRTGPSSISETRRGMSGSAGKHLHDAIEEARVDLVDDLQMARQQPLHQRDRPLLQRLRQQRVIGVAERALGDRPGALPGQRRLVDEQAHQLGHGQRGMRVVQLDRHLVGELDRTCRAWRGSGGRCRAARRRRGSTPASGAARGRIRSRPTDTAPSRSSPTRSSVRRRACSRRR